MSGLSCAQRFNCMCLGMDSGLTLLLILYFYNLRTYIIL